MGADRSPAQWFLLRGLARESGHWGDFVSQMRKAFPQDDVQALDLPGSGIHWKEPAPTSIEKTARSVREEFSKLRDPRRPGFLFSISLGSMVVVEWLRQDSSHVDGVVLINTSFRGFSPFYRRLWWDAYVHLFRALLSPDLVARERQIAAMVSNRPELYDELARQWAELARRRPIRQLTFWRQLLAASRYEPPLETPRPPVLLLNSLADRMVHPSCSEEIAARWHCELRRHPTAGHDLVIDAAPWTLNAVREWIEEQNLIQT